MDNVANLQVFHIAGNAPLHEIGEHVELLHGRLTLADILHAARDKLRVPEVEHAGSGLMVADLAQQGIALLQQVIVLRELMIVGRAGLRDFTIKKTAPFPRRPLDQIEVLGREQHRIEVADELLRTHGLAVQQDATPLAAHELKGECLAHARTLELQLDAARRLLPANELLFRTRTMRVAEGCEVDGLDDIRLPLCIGAEEDVDARIQRQRQRVIVAKIAQL